MPKLTTRFNDQYEAIGFTDGKLKDLIETHKKYRQEMAQRFLTQGDDEGHTVKSIVDNYQNQTKRHWYDNIWNRLGSHLTSPFGNPLSNLNTPIKRKIVSFFDMDASLENLLEINGYSNRQKQKYYKDLLNMSQEDFGKIKGYQSILGVDVNEIVGYDLNEFEVFRNILRQEVDKYQREIESAADSMKYIIINKLNADDAYNDDTILDDATRTHIMALVSGLNDELLQAVGVNDEITAGKFAEKLVQAFSKNTVFAEAFEKLFDPDLVELPVDEYIAKVNEFIDKIADVLGLNDEQKNKLRISLGFEEVDYDHIQPLINNVKNKLQDEFKNRVEKLDIGDLKIASEQIKVDDGVLLSWEEFVALLEEAKRNAQSLSDIEPKNLFETINQSKEAIDNFQSRLKSLGDTLSSIRSGNFEDSDLTDLLQEFPELADKTDDLETAILELINNALQVLYNTLGEDIPDSLKNSLQNLADIASGTAKNLHDAFSDINDSWDILYDFKKAMEEGFDTHVTDSLLQSVSKLSGELETLVAGYYAGVVTAEELYEALTKHYENDLKNYSKAIIKKNELNENFYNAIGLADTKVVNKFNENYGID